MPFLYRGTTAGWPGNACLQRERLTPTSRDPLVATLFGLECSRWGPAVLLAADAVSLAGLVASGNVLADIEQELAVMVSPSEFAERFVAWTVPIARARRVLHDLGYELPVTISSREALSEELRLWRRLRKDEIARFDSMVMAE
jgi:hypothetical protein